MTFQEWFNSAPRRAKYSNDNPAYLAAQEAWEAAHEECAKLAAWILKMPENDVSHAIRARGMK